MRLFRDPLLTEIEELYRQRFGHFARAAAAITHDRDIAVGAVQDAFADVVRSRRRYRREGPLEAWVWRAVVNAAGKVEPALPGLRSRTIASGGTATCRPGVRACLADPPAADRQRLALFLRYYADLDYRSIARASDRRWARFRDPQRCACHVAPRNRRGAEMNDVEREIRAGLDEALPAVPFELRDWDGVLARAGEPARRRRRRRISGVVLVGALLTMLAVTPLGGAIVRGSGASPTGSAGRPAHRCHPTRSVASSRRTLPERSELKQLLRIDRDGRLFYLYASKRATSCASASRCVRSRARSGVGLRLAQRSPSLRRPDPPREGEPQRWTRRQIATEPDRPADSSALPAHVGDCRDGGGACDGGGRQRHERRHGERDILHVLDARPRGICKRTVTASHGRGSNGRGPDQCPRERPAAAGDDVSSARAGGDRAAGSQRHDRLVRPARAAWDSADEAGLGGAGLAVLHREPSG